MHTLPGCKYYSYLIIKANGKQFGNNILINVEIKDKNRWKKLNESVINAFRDESLREYMRHKHLKNYIKI